MPHDSHYHTWMELIKWVMSQGGVLGYLVWIVLLMLLMVQLGLRTTSLKKAQILKILLNLKTSRASCKREQSCSEKSEIYKNKCKDQHRDLHKEPQPQDQDQPCNSQCSIKEEQQHQFKINHT